MAQRLNSEERARVEAMTAAGVGVKETAWRLGRHCSTVYRELARNCGSGGYVNLPGYCAGSGVPCVSRGHMPGWEPVAVASLGPTEPATAETMSASSGTVVATARPVSLSQRTFRRWTSARGSNRLRKIARR